MAIAIEDRIRRAIELARGHGATFVSPRVLAMLTEAAGVSRTVAGGAGGAGEPGEPSQARAAVLLGTRVGACGHAAGEDPDPRLPVGVPVYLVLEDEGTLVSRLPARESLGSTTNIDGVVGVLCRRGRIEVAANTFVVLEVEDGISARETQAEYAVPMSADARLAAFE